METVESDDVSNRTEESSHQYVIQKDLEPTAITDELLQRQIRFHGPTGEAARLCRYIPIDYTIITTLNLELLNILKIDHLWMFVNLERLSLKCNKIEKIESLDNLKKLRELNLSFNCIERIENLEQFDQLEDLSLFHNKIRKIENLNALKNLIRLSIGNNLIDTFDGIERLRFMSELHSLNLEGNPISDEIRTGIDLRLFIVAYLPQIKYYHYAIIELNEREIGRKQFKSELRLLEESEQKEINEMLDKRKDEEKMQKFSRTFVSQLNMKDILNRIITIDDHKMMLGSFGIDICQLFEQTNSTIHKQIERVFELSYKIHDSLMVEINQLDESFENSRKYLQNKGIAIIDDYISQLKEISSKTKRLIKQNVLNENIDNELDDLKEKFDTITDTTWYTLNEMETLFHERIEDIRKIFSENMKKMIVDFLQCIRSIFEEIKITGQEYYRLVAEKYEQQENKNITIEKAINFDRNSHWETSLSIQDYFFDCVNDWTTKTLDDYEREEYERNRSKLLEINSFLLNERKKYGKIQEEY